ncbi:cytochrome C biogenesis protein [Kosmotoga arenicorallina S304]|uniref:Cytochrome C biogenesis protein n=1 Tax=Kosmotoga arenicorallina S304 TaxID=1453497 RepID=A0A176JSY9_9BACT|nr:divalent cation tolerance protein CutA [Kosmotoga arenicorallina]OAA26336.1 cytochrome C biogenesis protein [Kosmotoga arenicorallina S304]
MEYEYVKFEVFIPKGFVDELRKKVNAAGACRLGNYDNCISYHPVTGYWRPLEGSNPYLGEVGKIEKGKEMKVEFICSKKYVDAVIKAIRDVHPYEEPMFFVIPLLNK